MLIFFVIATFSSVLAIIIKLLFKKKYLYILPGLFLIVLLTTLIYRGGFDQTGKGKKVNNISARVKYGSAALQVIKKNLLLGIGLGDKKNELIIKKEELPEGALPKHVFNSHNQFLDFWLAAGIIPLICFVLYLLGVWKNAIKQRYIVYIGTAYCFCLFCFTDAAMMVQRGQVFFLFFVWLFELDLKRKEEQKFLY